MSNCPFCEEKVAVSSEVVAGEMLDCPTCGACLEVMIEDELVELVKAAEEYEDWGESGAH